ncbi:MAG: ABC transporter permease subunit [Oscillospiraceae bacterium]
MKISGMEHKKELLIKALRVLFGALVWLCVWQIIYMIVNREVLIASPLSVFSRLFEMASEKSFWLKTFNSLFAILEGYVLAIISGVLLAALTSSSKIIYDIFKPAISVIKSTPVASFIILALIWMTKQSVPIFISFLMVLPIVWANVSSAIKETDYKLLEMAKSYKIPKSKIVSKIYIPSILPSFLSAATTGLGFAWKSGIAAEVLSTPQNTIGSELYNAKIYIETVDLFAWTVAVIILSMILEKIVVFSINKIFKSK